MTISSIAWPSLRRLGGRPDGNGKIVFDSNRLRAAGEPVTVSDLFLMNHDGTEQVFLTRGGSPTWAPPDRHGRVSKMIAFHASASGVGLPVNAFPGAATEDSDIFVVNVDDLPEKGAVPRNLTLNRSATVDDGPNWSPDGQKILFTSYVNDPSTTVTTAEIHMIAEGTDQEQITNDGVEKRGPAFLRTARSFCSPAGWARETPRASKHSRSASWTRSSTGRRHGSPSTIGRT